MLTSSLACGPMSNEVIEAVFRYSHKFGVQLMLICSRNQVDADHGYVFTTPQYTEYIDHLRRSYPQANVVICRDHCGPGFGLKPEHDLDQTRRTIRCDLENGFDLIHLDLCHMQVEHDQKIRLTTELMQFALGINPNVMFEIGTDENVGVTETDTGKIVAGVRACQQVATPVFYVVQTGSLVREAHNTGTFDANAVGEMYRAISGCGVKLKEHNADYLSREQLELRRGIVDAVNIAPQLGVVQTNYILSQALLYGIDTQPFVDEVTEGGRWKKWVNASHALQQMLVVLVAGHYHFNGPAYKELADQLSKEISVREGIIHEVTKVIEHYLFALEGDNESR